MLLFLLIHLSCIIGAFVCVSKAGFVKEWVTDVRSVLFLLILPYLVIITYFLFRDYKGI